MANVYFEEAREHPNLGWYAPDKLPFEHLYGPVPGNPSSPAAKLRPPSGLPFCSANLTRRQDAAGCQHGGCPVGRVGHLCEEIGTSFCLRDCAGHGQCDAGFCWCAPGWYGIDCSERADGDAPLLQQQQRLVSPAAASGLRIYVYDMPSEFTTRLLQWRGSHPTGLSRTIDPQTGESQHTAGSLYAAELALHEWLLDSPLRTKDPSAAHLFYVPIYLASLFMHPIVKFADQPYYGRDGKVAAEGGGFREPRDRSQQGTLLMLRALRYIQYTYPFWNASAGRDHIWLMLHDEGPCFCPKAIRNSILLTHYGYYATTPKAWGTFGDDLFLRHHDFYRRYLGQDPRSPGVCFQRKKDLVIPPWKTPSFWQRALLNSPPPAAARKGLVFFAGDLGFNRIAGYSHDLRQLAFALFCNPQTTKRRDCTPVAYDRSCDCECRKDMPQNCSRWRPGVTIQLHSRRYDKELNEHVFCLAFPGDGWSSRVLDGIIHGCIPVIVQDDSEMFLEGAFADAGLGVPHQRHIQSDASYPTELSAPSPSQISEPPAGLDYPDFSVRIREAELPRMVEILMAIPASRVAQLQRAGLRVRDFFVYKDMYNPNQADRQALLASGVPGHDAFVLIIAALESRALKLRWTSASRQPSQDFARLKIHLR